MKASDWCEITAIPHQIGTSNAVLSILRIVFVEIIKKEFAKFQNSGNLQSTKAFRNTMKAITLNPTEKESPRLERLTLIAAGMTLLTAVYLLVTNLV